MPRSFDLVPTGGRKAGSVTAARYVASLEVYVGENGNAETPIGLIQQFITVGDLRHSNV
jgi:hypothetical protein